MAKYSFFNFLQQQSITTRGVGSRLGVGVGYVIIPNNEDREEYIRRVYKTGLLFILLEDGGVVGNVPVSKSEINNIDFPQKESEIGSTVVWINKPHNNQPIIIGVLNKENEMFDIDEKEFFYGKEGVGFKGSSKTKIIYINSSETQIKASKSILNKSKDIKLEGSSKVGIITGEEVNIEIFDEKEKKVITFIKVKKKEGVSIVDEFGNEINTLQMGLELKNKKNSLKKIMDAIIDELAKSTTATAIGTQPLLNAMQITALKLKVGELFV